KSCVSISLLGCNVNPKYLRSSFPSLYKEIIIKITTKLNGNADIIAADCSASSPVSPPANNSTYAIAANASPQTIFINPDGFNVPYAVCIPKTKVAESAEVIKNEAINANAIIDSINPNGNSLNIPNNCVSGGILNISLCDCPTSIPVTPNALNQIILITTGTPNTAITNSRMLRPLEILAINIPTNGLQLIQDRKSTRLNSSHVSN